MKKKYIIPKTEVVKLNATSTLLAESYGGIVSSRQDEDYNWEEEY